MSEGLRTIPGLMRVTLVAKPMDRTKYVPTDRILMIDHEQIVIDWPDHAMIIDVRESLDTLLNRYEKAIQLLKDEVN
jgi:hypothetical protein